MPAQRVLRLLPITDFLWRAKGCCETLALSPDGVREDGHVPVARFFDLSASAGAGCYVAELIDGKVIGEAKLVATADDWVLGDLQFLYGAADPTQHWLLKQRRFRLPKRLQASVAMVAGSNGDNYYHWLFDSLPRLHLLQLAGYDLEDLDYFVLNAARPAFQVQTLAYLGISVAKLIYTSKRELLECGRLVVPSMPGLVGYPPAWVCGWLRRTFLATPYPVSTRKIYISRAHAQGRQVVNESAILPMLAEFGFEVVHAEHLSFAQQVELFSSARQIVAVHGAGMSNIVFAPPEAEVLELCSPIHGNDCFSTLAANGDLRYDSLVLDLPNADVAGQDSRFGNLLIQPEALRRKLEQFAR